MDTRDPLEKAVARSAHKREIKAAVAAERERCAKVAEESYRDERWHVFFRKAGEEIAYLIRRPNGS